MARFLVLDDEPDVLFLLEANLTVFGHGCVTTTDQGQARTALLAGGFDGLIIDLTMPGLSGSEFIELIRREGIEPPHIFILSAVPPERLAAVARELGVHGIAKPFTSASLLEDLAPALDTTAR